MNAYPLVSVLMTAYNREKYIGEAIESVLASSYSNFELIIVDDGSSDGTVKIAKEYEVIDSRLKVYVNEKNLGDYHNRNKAASYATGKYIKYLDSDDAMYPWCLQVMVYCMEQYPSVALGLTSNTLMDVKYPLLLSSIDAYKMYYFKNLVLGIGPTGTIIRRDVFEKLSGFSGEQFIGDTELWLKITQKNNSVWMPPGLFYWRVHSGQQIVLESLNAEVEAIRHRLNKYYLASTECPLSKQDSKLAIRNLTNIKCRSIVKNLCAGKISESVLRKKKLNLTATDFFSSIYKNRYPDRTL